MVSRSKLPGLCTGTKNWKRVRKRSEKTRLQTGRFFSSSSSRSFDATKAKPPPSSPHSLPHHKPYSTPSSRSFVFTAGPSIRALFYALLPQLYKLRQSAEHRHSHLAIAQSIRCCAASKTPSRAKRATPFLAQRTTLPPNRLPGVATASKMVPLPAFTRLPLCNKPGNVPVNPLK